MKIPTPQGLVRKLKHSAFVDRRNLHQVWEAEQLRRFLAYYRVDCVLDVGANFGQYARMLRTRAKYRDWIVSFEPNPEAVAALRKAAQGDARWLIEDIAVSDRDGVQTFNMMPNSEFNSLSVPHARQKDFFAFRGMNVVQRTIEVRVEALGTVYRRLKQKLAFERPFLKLDTQGFDARIVAAGRDVMHQFVGLQSELSVRPLYQDSPDFRDAIALYESLGFTLSAFVPNNAGHFPLLIETDCIMVRSELVRQS